MNKKRFLMIFNFTILIVGMAFTFNNCSMPTSQSPQSSATSTCTSPVGVNTNPQTIEEAVTLINALPKPTTVDCFISSLARPIHMYATYSQSSAQPAMSPRSPRIFIFKGNLIISIVPEGPSSDMIEFSVVRGIGRSLKAELEFPVRSQLPLSAPYDRVKTMDGGSRCAGCHTGEFRDNTITFAEAYVSSLVQPFYFSEVSLATLRNEYLTCRPDMELKRCAILSSIFAHGETLYYNFSAP
jgi:hypothetical protein